MLLDSKNEVLLMNKQQIFISTSVAILFSFVLASCNGSSSEPSIKTFAEMLSEISTSFLAQGKLESHVYDSDDQLLRTETDSLVTCLSDGRFYQQIKGEMTSFYEIYYSRATTGYLEEDYINHNNVMESKRYEDLWEESGFANPFLDTTADEFAVSLSDSSVFNYKGSVSKIINFETTMMMRDFEECTMSIQIIDDAIRAVSFSTDKIYDEIDETYRQYDANLTFSNIGSIIAPSPSPYVTSSEHLRLKSAFDTMKNQNYSVSDVLIQDDEIRTIDYKVTSDNVLLAIDGNQSGIKNNASTGCYEYNIVSGVAYKRARHVSKSVSDFCPSFNFAPEIFEVIDQNTFRLRSGFEMTVVPMISFNANADLLEIHDVELKLDSTTGSLKTFSFNYSLMFGAKCSVIDTFSQIGTTSINDIDFSDVRNATNWKQQSWSIDAGLSAILGSSYDVPYKFLNCGWTCQLFSNYINIASINYDGEVVSLIGDYEILLINSGFVKQEHSTYTSYSEFVKNNNTYIYVGASSNNIDLYVRNTEF